MNINKWRVIIFELISSVCLEVTIRKLSHVTSNWVISFWEKTLRINNNEYKRGSSNLTSLIYTYSLQCLDLVLTNFLQLRERCSRSPSTLSILSDYTIDLISRALYIYLNVLKKSKNCKKSWKKLLPGEELAIGALVIP